MTTRRHPIRNSFVCVLAAAVALSLVQAPGAWSAPTSNAQVSPAPGEQPPFAPGGRAPSPDAPGPGERPASGFAAPAPGPFDEPSAGGLRPEFVAGEVVVSFRRGLSLRDRARRLADSGLRRSRRLAPRLELARLPKSADVRATARALSRDPFVEYAEPNYIYRAARLLPNDPRFKDLWGLDNQSQKVGGVSGTPNADIDAPEAWAVGTGSKDIVVAVADTGVARDHPDLATNTWVNPRESLSGTDESGNGLIDDVHGWDFVDRNNEPWDLSGHGSHVAGTIAAAGHNGVGVTGVTWRASIMALRVLNAEGFGTAADIAAAFRYAGANGAHVVNASFGGPGLSSAVRDAIQSSPSTMFVAAAGNSGSDNDSTPSYPCNYELPNVVCVAATDHNDGLASFSSYGANKVHLGAPGVRILSTVPAFTNALFDRFESPLAGRWTSGGTNDTWGRASDQHGYYLADSPDGSYLPNTDSWIRTADPIDLGGLHSCRLRYVMRLDTEFGSDGVFVEASSNAESWTRIASWSGSSAGKWFRHNEDLSAFDGDGAYLRFRLVSDGAVQGAGVDLDDVQIRCLSAAYTGNELSFFAGTSMAAPHAAGAAALLWSLAPGAKMSEVKNALLSGTDPIPALAGKTVTGGRLNVFGAIGVLDPGEGAADPEPSPSPSQSPSPPPVIEEPPLEEIIDPVLDPDPEPEPSPEPEPDPALDPDPPPRSVETHDRTVRRVARQRLRVRGRVRAPGAPARCRRRAPVIVRGPKGAIVRRTRAGAKGFFRVRLPARGGRYRVVARRRVLNGGDDVCRIARFVVRVRR